MNIGAAVGPDCPYQTTQTVLGRTLEVAFE